MFLHIGERCAGEGNALHLAGNQEGQRHSWDKGKGKGKAKGKNKSKDGNNGKGKDGKDCGESKGIKGSTGKSKELPSTLHADATLFTLETFVHFPHALEAGPCLKPI